MPTLLSLTSKITDIIQENSVEDIASRINDCVSMIAGGVRMPDGQTSPPLPDLYSLGTVSTATDAAFVSLPATYNRKVSMIVDSAGDKILPPIGGDYYSFLLFLNQVQKKDLSESGTVYQACIKGSNLYYQGIPSEAKTLSVHFYRLPVDMAANTDTPDGIPLHLQNRLIVHWVCGNIFGEGIEDGETSEKKGHNYHLGKFYTAMTDLIDFIGVDSEPIYYGNRNLINTDLGICD